MKEIIKQCKTQKVIIIRDNNENNNNIYNTSPTTLFTNNFTSTHEQQQIHTIENTVYNNNKKENDAYNGTRNDKKQNESPATFSINNMSKEELQYFSEIAIQLIMIKEDYHTVQYDANNAIADPSTSLKPKKILLITDPI